MAGAWGWPFESGFRGVGGFSLGVVRAAVAETPGLLADASVDRPTLLLDVRKSRPLPGAC